MIAPKWLVFGNSKKKNFLHNFLPQCLTVTFHLICDVFFPVQEGEVDVSMALFFSIQCVPLSGLFKASRYLKLMSSKVDSSNFSSYIISL